MPQFNTVVLILVSVFGLVHLIVVHSLTQAEVIGFGATLLILGLIMCGAALALRFRNQATQAVIWISSRVARWRRESFDPEAAQMEIHDLFDAWDALRQGAWHRPLEGACLNMAFDMLTTTDAPLTTFVVETSEQDVEQDRLQGDPFVEIRFIISSDDTSPAWAYAMAVVRT